MDQNKPSPKAIELGEKDELTDLRKKLFKKGGEPKKNAKAADLARFNELMFKFKQAEEPMPPLRKLAKPETLRRYWQDNKRARWLLDQDLNIRRGDGLTDADRKEAQELINKFPVKEG